LIVADTNILAYLYLPCEHTLAAETLLQRDADWAAPVLWRSELRNVLALYLRRATISFERAYAIQREAEQLLTGNEFELDSFDVLSLAHTRGLSAYDAEFAVLAQQLKVPLVTMDRRLLEKLPDTASSLEHFVS